MRGAGAAPIGRTNEVGAVHSLDLSGQIHEEGEANISDHFPVEVGTYWRMAHTKTGNNVRSRGGVVLRDQFMERRVPAHVGIGEDC